MRKLLKFIIPATMTALSPAMAQSERDPEWWLVLDESNGQSAQFVDLASMTRSGQTVEVSALVLNRSGDRETKEMTVYCGTSGGEPVTNFVCGSEEYRTATGLILGMVSPDEMAQMLFAAQSGNTPVRGSYQA